MRFIFNLFFAVFLAVCASPAASLIGIDALGAEQPPQNATVIRSGLFSQNPAINAFENKTKFGTEIKYEHAEAQGGSNSISLNSFTVPSISMVLPLGFLGAFGIGLEQKYFASNRMELIDTVLDANISLSSRTGIYTVSPSYSIRLPFVNDIAVGTSYRIFFGNSYKSLERGKSQSWGDSQSLGDSSWMARNIQITTKETADFESVGDWWKNFGYSMHLHRKSADYFISYFPSVQIRKNIKEKVQFSNSDTLSSNNYTEEFKMPKSFASGAHFRFLQNHNLSFVYEQQNFEETELAAETEKAVSYFAEYKILGTGLHYSTFLKRNNFGMNVWYTEKYLKDVNEYGVSLLSDLWLGRRGTLVGITFFGGLRQAEQYWDESFFGFKLNLTGVGNWGTSSRRR